MTYKREDKAFKAKLSAKGEPVVKAYRKIIGLVAQVMLPCGCSAVVAQGEAHTESGVQHMVHHVCVEWKAHKYELANAERDLAARLKKFRRVL